MKKTIVLAIIGLTAGLTTSSYGQGAIRLDNYNSYGPYVTYGIGSDGTVGTGLNANYTMGLYYWNGPGNNVGLVAADPGGMAIPSTLNPNLLLATGAGSTAQFYATTALTPGCAYSGSVFNVPGSLTAGGQVWTFMIIAYEGASYATAFQRAHSAAFTLVISDASSPATVMTGSAMPAFTVGIPEPTTMALAGLGGLSLLFFRRKKA